MKMRHLLTEISSEEPSVQTTNEKHITMDVTAENSKHKDTAQHEYAASDSDHEDQNEHITNQYTTYEYNTEVVLNKPDEQLLSEDYVTGTPGGVDVISLSSEAQEIDSQLHISTQVTHNPEQSFDNITTSESTTSKPLMTSEPNVSATSQPAVTSSEIMTSYSASVSSVMPRSPTTSHASSTTQEPEESESMTEYFSSTGKISSTTAELVTSFRVSTPPSETSRSLLSTDFPSFTTNESQTTKLFLSSSRPDKDSSTFESVSRRDEDSSTFESVVTSRASTVESENETTKSALDISVSTQSSSTVARDEMRSTSRSRSATTSVLEQTDAVTTDAVTTDAVTTDAVTTDAVTTVTTLRTSSVHWSSDSWTSTDNSTLTSSGVSTSSSVLPQLSNHLRIVVMSAIGVTALLLIIVLVVSIYLCRKKIKKRETQNDDLDFRMNALTRGRKSNSFVQQSFGDPRSSSIRFTPNLISNTEHEEPRNGSSSRFDQLLTRYNLEPSIFNNGPLSPGPYTPFLAYTGSTDCQDQEIDPVASNSIINDSLANSFESVENENVDDTAKYSTFKRQKKDLKIVESDISV